MATFRVGQRVRVVNSEQHPEAIGQTGTVAGELQLYESLMAGRWLGHVVVIDAWGSTTNPVTGIDFIPRPEFLVPLTDSHEKTTWDQCVWKPEHLRERV